MVDRQARLALLQYLGNKQLQDRLSQLKDGLKVDSTPLKELGAEMGEANSQQSMLSALSINLLQSIDANMGQILDELKRLNHKEEDGPQDL